jgi:Domain of unknown function DUF11/Secretion system C-terminal sorting domain/CARDB
MYLQKHYTFLLHFFLWMIGLPMGHVLQAQTTPAKLAIIAIDAPTAAKTGDKVTFKVTIKNTGGVASSDKNQIAIVRQQLGFLPQAIYNAQGNPTNLAPLAAGASIIVPMTYTIETACGANDPRQVCIADLGGVSPVVQIAGIGADFMPALRTDKVVFPDFKLTPILPSVDLSTTLQLTSKFVDANSNFTYRITLKNNGIEKATNITLIPSKGTEIDPCQNGTILEMTPSKGKIDKNACPNAFFWTGFDLAPGETTTCDVAMNVQGTGVACFAFNYKIAVAALFFCGKDTNAANTLASETFSPTTPVVPIVINGAKLTITNVAGATTAKVGEKITLQVTVKNTGNATSATDAQLAMVRKQTGFIQPYQDITQGTPVAIAPLAAGASRTIAVMYVVETACDLPRQPCELDRIGLSPTLQVAGIGKDFMPLESVGKVVFPNFKLTPATPNFDLVTSIQQIGTGIPAGGNLKYRITIKNNGPDKATDIILQPKAETSGCEIDKIVTLTPSKGNTGRACSQEMIAYWNGFSLASGESATCDVEMSFTRNPLTACPTLATYTAMVGALSFCGNDTNETNNLATATLSKAATQNMPSYFYVNNILMSQANPQTDDDITINVRGSFSSACTRLENSSFVVVGNQINVTLNFTESTNRVCTQALVEGVVKIPLKMLPAGKYCVNFMGKNFDQSAYLALPSEKKCFTVIKAIDIPVFHFYANSIKINPTAPLLPTNEVTVNIAGNYANDCGRLVSKTMTVVGNQINITLNFEALKAVKCEELLVAATIPITIGQLHAGTYCVNLLGNGYSHGVYDGLSTGKCFTVSQSTLPPSIQPTLTISAAPQVYRQSGYNQMTVTVENQTGAAITFSQVLLNIGNTSRTTDTLMIAEEVGKASVISKGTRLGNVWSIGTMPNNTKATWTFYTLAKLLSKNIPIQAVLTTTSKGTLLKEMATTTLTPTTSMVVTPPSTIKDMAVTLSTTPTTYTQYKNLPFKVTVTNHSNQTMSAIKVALDYIEQGKLPFVSANPGIGSYNHVDKLWTIGALSAKQTVTLTLVLFPMVKGEDLSLKATLAPTDDLPRNNLATIIVKNALVPRAEPVANMNFGISKIYPNPVEDVFLLEIQSAQLTKATIEIYNAIGLPIQRTEKALLQGSNEIWMDATAFPYGVYIVRVTDEKGAHSTRTIVR